jgi:hypothetical protein
MSQDHPVYDLGDVDLERTRADLRAVFDDERLKGGGARFRGAGRGPSSRVASLRRGSPRVGPALAGSLSMFVPGLGQLATGEIAWGLFYVTGIGLCAAVLWAALSSLDRLIPTLALLGVPIQALAIMLIVSGLSVVALHLGSIVHAFRAGEEAWEGSVPHPIVTGLASLLIPGWGQILAGHRRRAVVFLTVTWLLALAWLLVTPTAARLLALVGLALPPSLKDGWGPITLLAAPVVVWTIAIYDGAAGAASERARSF